ncbi:LysR family transcriptional regulator [Paenibacillus sp. GCM10027626]|uniref:LysR family transcriptional regulator n=1 Tax=Paenibacillus sp. GCM10027626 TaxID=3273411 RepID=UPI003636ADFA
MDTRHVHYFLAVCKHLHFTKAAQELGISQPTLSQQIRVLEDELGAALFDRIGKKTILTEAGKLLLIYSKKMLEAEHDAKEAIKQLLVGGGGTIRLSVLPSDLDFQLVPLFVRFHEYFPATQLQAISSLTIHEDILENKADLGIGLIRHEDSRLLQIPLRSEPYELIVSRAHPLAEKKQISLQDIKDLPIVMYPRGFLGRELVEKACREQGFQLTTVMETTTASSLLQLTRANIGATIQPQGLLCQSADRHEYVVLPITDYPPIRHLSLIYRSDRFIGTAQKQLTAWLIEYFEQL